MQQCVIEHEGVNKMNRNSKSTFRPDTERKISFYELVKAAERKRDQQIADSIKQKSKEKEQAVI